MKKSELVIIGNVLENMSKIDSASVKFKYAIARNIKLLAPIVSPILEMRDKIQKEFENTRIEICKNHCAKDESGEPIFEGDNFTGLQGNAEFETDIKGLYDSFKTKFTDFNSLIEEDEEINLYKINLSDIPNDITTEQFIVLEPIITE